MTPEHMQALWASHCKYEFELRDVEGALSTTVGGTVARLRDLQPS